MSWYIGSGDKDDLVVFKDMGDRGKPIANVINGTEDTEKNARLIVAAPDLLEALESLVAVYARAWDASDGCLVFSPGSVAEYEEVNARARAAIAKATTGFILSGTYEITATTKESP